MFMEKQAHMSSIGIFDYFLVSGLSAKTPASSSIKEVIDGPNGRALVFQPSLLHRFPDNVAENFWNPSVQNTLLQLCHPNDVRVAETQLTKIPDFHSFLLTREDAFRTYGYVLTYHEMVSNEAFTDDLKRLFKEKEGNPNFPGPLFAQKCICLISRQAYINTAEKILRMLYSIFVLEKRELKFAKSSLPIDSYIYNLLYEMPAPSFGNSLALNWNSFKPIIIQRPAIFELPLLDVHLSELFNLLGGPFNVLRLLTSAFLEHQILLVSKDCQKLMLVAEAVTALMFPFQWLHAYIPVLPYKLAINFLDAPLPYIMGIPADLSEDKLKRISSDFDQCFVDIDRSLVDCPEGQPNFPNQTALMQYLTKAYEKYLRERENQKSSDMKKDSVNEPIALLGDNASPRSQRRNAYKRQSSQISEMDTRPTDVNEELRNLHAVSNAQVQEPSVMPDQPDAVKLDEEEIQEHHFNVKVREMIFGTLISLLAQYDKFVILPDIEDSDFGKKWFLTRDSQQNFDKSSFLSDQVESHLQFLSAFLETQAFVSLIDNCILSQMDSTLKDFNLKLFDNRIKQAKSMPRSDKLAQGLPSKAPGKEGLSRSLSIISAGQSVKSMIGNWIQSSEKAFSKRYAKLAGYYPSLKPLQKQQGNNPTSSDQSEDITFPKVLYPALLQERIAGTELEVLESSTSPSDIQRSMKKPSRQTSISDFSPEMIARTNWEFLDKLLKEVKAKTNRLVVRKMGKEAIELGHSEISILGIEENTLIGSLCDLLERIWCHGLHSDQKKGKSALWSHLLCFEKESVRIVYSQSRQIIESVEGSRLAGLGSHSRSHAGLSKLESLHMTDRRYSQPTLSQDGRYISPVPTDIITSVRRVQKLDEVKTDVGKFRAWIRLSLEQKQLQVHLKKLLLNRPLLQTMYKRYSLLRCDDEREQFLYHILSLNAVDFTCFTNSFTKTDIEYRVWIFPKKNLNGFSQTSANVHIILSGEIRCTDRIAVPKNCTEFSFQHKNTGVLITALLGHDSAGLFPKWGVDFVVVRNEFTGQAYFMHCGRWLGRSVDDGSTERLLYAQSIASGKDLNVFIHEVSSGRMFDQMFGRSFDQRIEHNIDVLCDRAGQAVNAIVKHFHRPGHDRSRAGALTSLLLKPNGLIPLITQVFQHGLKASGMFRKPLFAWDVLTEVCKVLSQEPSSLKQNHSIYQVAIDFVRNRSPQRLPAGAQLISKTSPRHSSPQSSGRDEEGPIVSDLQISDGGIYSQRLVRLHEILTCEQERGLGKDDLFQLLVCHGLKERCLGSWIKYISSVLLEGSSLYNKHAFLCNRLAVNDFSSVLANLSEYDITFEPIIMRGVNVNLP